MQDTIDRIDVSNLAAMKHGIAPSGRAFGYTTAKAGYCYKSIDSRPKKYREEEEILNVRRKS